MNRKELTKTFMIISNLKNQRFNGVFRACLLQYNQYIEFNCIYIAKRVFVCICGELVGDRVELWYRVYNNNP